MALDLSNLKQPGAQAAGAVSAPATAPADNLDAAFAKIGGKVVRRATPKPSAEPDPDAFGEVGGKYVGKIPAAVLSSAKE
jgi:hypothetical protein